MTAVYQCDRCGRYAQAGPGQHTNFAKFVQLNKLDMAERQIDLCPACAKAFEAFLRCDVSSNHELGKLFACVAKSPAPPEPHEQAKPKEPEGPAAPESTLGNDPFMPLYRAWPGFPKL